MPDLASLADFHFLRPLWLLALLPAVLLFLAVRRQASEERRWRGVIAPHLLSHLIVGAQGGRVLRPIHLVVALLVCGVLGAAGPSWEREPSPFTEDTAPLVIALDLSRSMNARDVQPSRLARSKQKIRDLLALRPGARTALIVYSGTAHTVLPLCDDISVFESFIDALSTDVMPVRGKDSRRALHLAEELLEGETAPGSILFLTDGIPAEHVPDFVSHRKRTNEAMFVLAVGTKEGGPVRTEDGRFETDTDGRRLHAKLDVEGLEALAEEARAFVVSVTVDDADVRHLQRKIQTHLQRANRDDAGARWKDAGYFLVFPVAFLGLIWFRRGWSVRWGTVILLATFSVTGCSTTSSDTPDTAGNTIDPGSTTTATGGEKSKEQTGFPFVDLWLTPDQQGHRLFERRDYLQAAESFEDPYWKGLSFYRANEMESAIDWFGRLDSPEAEFALGNSYARLGRFELAVASYDAALDLRPAWAEAEENRALIRALVRSRPEEKDPPMDFDPTSNPAQFSTDELGEQGEMVAVPAEELSDEEIAEIWMRRLQTSPAEFLQSRFAIEAASQEGEGP